MTGQPSDNESAIGHRLKLRVSELKTDSSNEAMTRLKLIDEILFGPLAWTKEDVRVEEHIGEDGISKYADYILSTGRQSILVEAKKLGANFDGLPSGRKALLRGAWLKRPVGEAVIQARDYARKLSTGFCIATNGITWIVFPVNRRDQINFESSSCIIIHDIISELTADPADTINLLSRQAVIGGSLDRTLLGSDRDQNEPRRLNDIYDRSFSRVNRSSIFPSIEREIVTAFSEDILSENPSLIEKCYVQTPERIRFDSRLKMYLSPREQVLKAQPIRPISPRGRNAVKELLNQVKIATRPIALITVGLVGAGKTTFLFHTANVTAAGMFDKNAAKPAAYWIYVDFRNYTTTQEPRTIIISELFDYIKSHPYLSSYENFIRFAYADDISALKSGPLSLLMSDEETQTRKIADAIYEEWKAKEPYAIKIISHAAKALPVFMVIDNVDQIEDVAIQSKIFLEATALTRQIRGNLIIAMRDSTYVKNRSSAVFDAFDFDAVYIDPPDILAVLSRRFSLAEQLLIGKNIVYESESGARLVIDNGKLIIQLLNQSVLGTEVGRIIEVTATGDTRLALRMTRQFLQYGYSSTAKALEIFHRTGKYIMPAHEALRAIALGNQSVYREEFSVFGNPFDARLGRSDLQLVRLYVMSALYNYSTDRGFEGLAAKEIVSCLETLGISESSSETVIRDLLRFRYVFSTSHRDYTRESILIPSRLCGYVVRELISRLVFVETTMYDTYIGDDETWDTLKENMRRIYREKNLIHKLAIRKEVASLFYDFAEERLEYLAIEARERGLPPQWCHNALTRGRAQFVEDLSKAMGSARRLYSTGPVANDETDLPLFAPEPTDAST